MKIGGTIYEPGEFVLLEEGDQTIEFVDNGRFVMLGGDAFETIPYVEWNFVSFDKDRIEQAKEDWRKNRFPTVPGDNKEHIPY